VPRKSGKLAETKARAAQFRASRKQHVSEAAEDYTELVADLIEEDGEARTCEIAEHLGISHVTALRTIRRLQGEGYLETAPHRPVRLTAKGRKLANYCKQRHKLLVDFFIRIGVPESVAEMDVEGAEHHISPQTLRAITKFLGGNQPK
jgi:DtxR family manganese transport transcriptional regulator